MQAQPSWSTPGPEPASTSEVPPTNVPTVTFLNGSTLQVDLDSAQQTSGINSHVQYRVIYWTNDPRCAARSHLLHKKLCGLIIFRQSAVISRKRFLTQFGPQLSLTSEVRYRHGTYLLSLLAPAPRVQHVPTLVCVPSMFFVS